MAQTKKKRRSKHRGNAAGVVETRGRTGRKPTADEVKASDKEQARRDRMLRAPTWKAATQRAALAAVVFGALLLLAFKQKVGPAIGLTSVVFLFYIPLGYYTDAWIHKRRIKAEVKVREKRRP